MILFVCTANICRSPMAAAIMRRRIAEKGLADQVQVLSAGVWAEEGLEASRNAVKVLGGRNVDLSDHLSRRVTPALLDQANIVLVMEEAHRRSLFYLAPQHLGKVFLLSEMAGEYEDVADPYGGPIEEYERTADLLEKLIDAGLPKILRRLSIDASAVRSHSKSPTEPPA
ncbi:MAG: low molecular weight protein arginine phosphatase [Anaerolineae bacterium]